MSPESKKIRHNDLSERHLEDNEKLSPKKLLQRAAGEDRTVDSGEIPQLESPSGFQLFAIAVIIVTIAGIVGAVIISLMGG